MKEELKDILMMRGKSFYAICILTIVIVIVLTIWRAY